MHSDSKKCSVEVEMPSSMAGMSKLGKLKHSVLGRAACCLLAIVEIRISRTILNRECFGVAISTHLLRWDSLLRRKLGVVRDYRVKALCSEIVSFITLKIMTVIEVSAAPTTRLASPVKIRESSSPNVT